MARRATKCYIRSGCTRNYNSERTLKVTMILLPEGIISSLETGISPPQSTTIKSAVAVFSFSAAVIISFLFSLLVVCDLGLILVSISIFFLSVYVSGLVP